MKWAVFLTPQARKMLASVRDRRIRENIAARIEGLSSDTELQGKPLTDELKGLYSVRAAGQRYRIIYKIERRKILVLVVAVGIRKEGDREDIYRLAQKLIRLGLAP